jgi:hypothetical protein
VQRNTYAGTGSGIGGTGAGSGVGSGSGGCGSGSGKGLSTTSGPPAIDTNSGVMDFPSDECRVPRLYRFPIGSAEALHGAEIPNTPFASEDRV